MVKWPPNLRQQLATRKFGGTLTADETVGCAPSICLALAPIGDTMFALVRGTKGNQEVVKKLESWVVPSIDSWPNRKAIGRILMGDPIAQDAIWAPIRA